MQEVCTRAWQRAGRFDPAKGRGMIWLITIARYHAIDRIRARGDSLDDDGQDAVADRVHRAETLLQAVGEAKRVADRFATLEPDRAESVRGACLGDLCYLGLATRHSVPLNPMRTWLRRSLLKLKECLDR